MRNTNLKIIEPLLSILNQMNLGLMIQPVYHRRGLVKLFIGQEESGCLDFSKSGELENK